MLMSQRAPLYCTAAKGFHDLQKLKYFVAVNYISRLQIKVGLISLLCMCVYACVCARATTRFTGIFATGFTDVVL